MDDEVHFFKRLGELKFGATESQKLVATAPSSGWSLVADGSG